MAQIHGNQLLAQGREACERKEWMSANVMDTGNTITQSHVWKQPQHKSCNCTKLIIRTDGKWRLKVKLLASSNKESGQAGSTVFHVYPTLDRASSKPRITEEQLKPPISHRYNTHTYICTHVGPRLKHVIHQTSNVLYLT